MISTIDRVVDCGTLLDHCYFCRIHRSKVSPLRLLSCAYEDNPRFDLYYAWHVEAQFEYSIVFPDFVQVYSPS